MANMSFGVNLLPKTNNTYSLGNSDYKWNIFATQINGSNISDLVLPAVTSSNNGQILKVDNGAWTVGAAPTSLPAVTSSDNNKILQVSSGAWVVASLPNYYTKPSGGIPSTDLADTYLTSVPTMTGATSSTNGTAGLIPAPTSADAEKFFRGDGTWQDGGRPMVILSYGNSVWNDFITAYNNNVIVYCRASSNSNPATGSQTRMAFMAYVNNATKPTEVEFQYYRSMSSHSATAMGDEVYVYKLTSAGVWSVTVRKASIKEIAVASGSKLGVSWSSDKVTLSNTMTANDMPMSSSDATTTKTAIDTVNTKLGSTSMGTTATTITGAIAEHESDIGTLSSKLFNFLSSETDFNTITNDGLYKFDWVSNGGNYHRPVNQGGLLIVSQRTQSGIITQTYNDSNGRMFVRGFHDNAWTSWEELALNSNINTTYRDIYGSGSINDCNNAEIGKWYHVYPSASNVPIQATGILFTYGNSGDRHQICESASRYFVRRYTGSAWTNWEELALNSKFTNYTDITATTSETGSISLSNTTPWFSSSAVLTGAHIVGSVTAIDAFVMLVRSSAGNWFAKVFNWDMTPVKNTEVRIRVYGV